MPFMIIVTITAETSGDIESELGRHIDCRIDTISYE